MDKEKDFICDFLTRFTFRLAQGKLKTLRNCENTSDISRIVDFQEKCIKSYRSLQTAFKFFYPGELKLYVSTKVLKEFQSAWKEVFCGIEGITQKDFLEVEDGNQNFFTCYDRLTNLQFILDPPIVTEKSIRWILENKTKFKHPSFENYKVEIAMTGELIRDINIISLGEYRKHLLSRIILNSLRLKGYKIEEMKYYVVPETEDVQHDIFIITKELDERIISSTTEYEDKNQCENKVNRDQVFRIKIGHVSVQRTLNSTQETEAHSRIPQTLGSILSHTTTSNTGAHHNPNALSLLNFEILSKRPSSEIILKSDDLLTLSSQTQGPVVIINYTVSRIHSILNKFSHGVLRDDFPDLPSTTDVDFSCLAKSAEELSLIDALMEWPRLIDCLVDLSTEELMIPSVLRFLAELAHRFKVFYAKHVVLLPPSAHDFGVMFARIYLLRAILLVFEETLELLDGYL